MHNPETQPHLEGMSKRNILEGQPPEVLIGLKARILERMSRDETDVHLINDVLDGMGYTRYDEGQAYDANDGTLGSPEYPSDEKWAVVTIPENIVLGQE